MKLTRKAIETALQSKEQATLVTILSTKGSAPRDAGTQMLVTANSQTGTIGGGALEWEALRIAREFAGPKIQSFPLGPNLGQCCGGRVELRFAPLSVSELELTPEPKSTVWLYGAGHVGRAVIKALADLPFAVTWVDTEQARFPNVVPENVALLPASAPAQAVRYAPPEALHVVITYSHALDLEICAAVLKREHGWLGLIGSDTKAQRFRSRLQSLGCDEKRLTCPIGDPNLGKEPAAIAIGLASDLLRLHNEASAKTQSTEKPLEHLANSAS